LGGTHTVNKFLGLPTRTIFNFCPNDTCTVIQFKQIPPIYMVFYHSNTYLHCNSTFIPPTWYLYSLIECLLFCLLVYFCSPNAFNLTLLYDNMMFGYILCPLTCLIQDFYVWKAAFHKAEGKQSLTLIKPTDGGVVECPACNGGLCQYTQDLGTTVGALLNSGLLLTCISAHYIHCLFFLSYIIHLFPVFLI
jgi:hypothetical protein